MQIVIFDDHKISNFYPLTFTRIIGDLRCGILKNRQRILAYLNAEDFVYVMNESLVDLYVEKHPDWQINIVSEGETLFVNSRLKVTQQIIEEIINLKENQFIRCDKDIVAMRINSTKSHKTVFESILAIASSLSEVSANNCLWENVCDIISNNDKQIVADYEDFFYEKDNSIDTEMGVSVINPYSVWIGEGVEIKPGVILDATDGPIIIDEEAKIMHNAVIVGPAYIGKKSVIKIGAKIYEGTSIGPVCKVGGEVEESIIHGYSNKQHDGFLGHSYLGEWVNLGADTNNSDLKNNYKTVKMYNYAQKKKIDSKSQFIGCVIGDHSKTGIAVSINTGTVIGMGCNLYGSKLFKDFVEDFSWGEAGSTNKYILEKLLETMDSVKNRRNLKLLKSESNLYKKVFENKIHNREE